MSHTKAYIKVVNPGFYSSIQDKGRFGCGNLGVPNCGAMDHYSYALVNYLLNNPQNAACLEMTLSGGEFIFPEPTQICISGADTHISINGTERNKNRIISIQPGDHLTIGGFSKGSRLYLAIKHGFQTESILNSRSWYKGITKYHQLKKGQQLTYLPYNQFSLGSSSYIAENKTLFSTQNLEVYLAPEGKELPKSILTKLLQTEFHISPVQNRMGIQLEETLPNNLNEILTVPVYTGTVQLTPGGKIIILMRDAQVTGGYPRIFQLSEQAISILAQKKPGDGVNFKLIQD
ncbi:5-oxoprolinase subunit C family protein [Mangrovimonas aestuarii]|uniref:5-oxoprolinase subunit C family protein n=1 Tax=Mangrovimonas aestuarii TaxID=3018443 RepID=UPI002378429E|nr:biotin-dependent carboxyltransferase family protein [Mangrovimonas aestuarii]